MSTLPSENSIIIEPYLIGNTPIQTIKNMKTKKSFEDVNLSKKQKTLSEQRIYSVETELNIFEKAQTDIQIPLSESNNSKDLQIAQKHDNYVQKIPKNQYLNIEYIKGLLLEKSKVVKDQLSMYQFDNPSVFDIELQYFLQQMVSNRVINADFGNVNKSNFKKIESFFLEKIQQNEERKKLNSNYKQKSENLQKMFKNRLKQLENDLQNQTKMAF